MQIRNDDELKRLHRAGRGLVLNSNVRNVHEASCDFVASMRTSTRKEWFPSLAELRAAHGESWSHGCLMCDVGTAWVGSPTVTATATRPAAAHGETDELAEAVVEGPTGRPPTVSAWANRYVSFEPKHADQLGLRAELRARIAKLESAPDHVLHATFTGPLPRGADVENALFYNLDLDGRCFRRSSRRGLRFEHDPGRPPPLADGRSFACSYRYSIQPREADRLQCWVRSRHLATIDAVTVDLETGSGLADRVWLAVRRSRTNSATRRSADAPFAVELVVHPPRDTQPEPARLLKGLLDGVVAAFQAHGDQTTLGEVTTRIAERVQASSTDVRELLADSRDASLGIVPRLLVPWGKTVQWDPSDDKLVAGAVLVAPPAGESWRLSGEVLAVEPRPLASTASG